MKSGNKSFLYSEQRGGALWNSMQGKEVKREDSKVGSLKRQESRNAGLQRQDSRSNGLQRQDSQRGLKRQDSRTGSLQRQDSRSNGLKEREPYQVCQVYVSFQVLKKISSVEETLKL